MDCGGRESNNNNLGVPGTDAINFMAAHGKSADLRGHDATTRKRTRYPLTISFAAAAATFYQAPSRHSKWQGSLPPSSLPH